MGFPIIDGFDLYASTSGTVGLYNRWTNASGGGSITLIAGRFGGQAVRMTDATGDTTALRRWFTPAISQFAMGQAIRLNSMGNLGNQPFNYLTGPAGHQLTVYIDGASGIIRVYRGAGVTALITSPAGTIKNGIWAYYEVIGVLDQVAGWVELWVDGVLMGRFDGDTCQTAETVIDNVYIYHGDHGGSGNSGDRDDFYLSDQAVRIGECRVETLRPVADTAQKQFVPSTVGTNFDDVDDTTFAIADYVEGSNINDLDLYEIADLSSIPATIHAVKPVFAAWKTDAGGRQAAAVVDSGGTQDTGPAAALTNDAKIFDGSALAVNPNGGAAWNSAAVNALKLGPKVTA